MNRYLKPILIASCLLIASCEKETTEKSHSENIVGTWQSKSKTTVEIIGNTTSRSVTPISYLKLKFEVDGTLTYFYNDGSTLVTEYIISGNLLTMGREDAVMIKSLNSKDLNLIIEKEEYADGSMEHSIQFVKE